MWPDLTKASFHTQWQGWLFTTTTYINELTIHVCNIANRSLACFSWGFFLEPVWHTQVLGWHSNGSVLSGQAPTQMEIAIRLTRKLGCRIGYHLWYLELKWTSGETIWQCLTFMHGKLDFLPPLCSLLWYWCKSCVSKMVGNSATCPMHSW